MTNGESDAPDADDWRGHVALAASLVARRQAEQAVVVARRAVALAPDEPDARLALADALLAVRPRGMGNRAAAFAEVDRAELLGVDAADLVDRRARPKSAGYQVAAMVTYFPFMIFGVEGQAGVVGVAIAWPAMILFIVGTFVVRLRPPGGSFWEVLGVKREISRRRRATIEQVVQVAPAGAAVLAFLNIATAWLAIPGADGDPPSLVLAWLSLVGIPTAVVAAWIIVDRWFWPGTVIRVLRRDAFVACSVPITLIAGVVVPVLAIRGLRFPGLWFGLFLGQMAWITGNAVGAMRICSRRKKAASLGASRAGT